MPKAIKVHLVVLMMAIVKKPSTSLQKKIVEKVILVKYLLVQEKIKPMPSSASFNRFNGNQQISFIGQGNNINQQNFSVQDLLGTMSSSSGGGGGRGGGMFGGGGNIGNFLTGTQSGIAKTWAAGLNYNDVWGKKNQR
jgi:hypothetical protein